MRFSFFQRNFAHLESLRSDSDNGKYVKIVKKAVNNDRFFFQFKRHPDYRNILEHVTSSQGKEYLDIIYSRPDRIFNTALNSVLISDSVGSPFKFNYKNIEIPLSPTTLRYLKVASDLFYLFGNEVDFVAEIGGGYGGQCLVNDNILYYKHTTIFDLPVVGELIKKYLDHMLMNGSFRVTTLNQELPRKFDLVISNYAFSELPRKVQIKYIEKVLSNSERGYLTMNSGMGIDKRNYGKLSIDELTTILPPFDCILENPQTSPNNYIIIWGHKDALSTKFFGDKLNFTEDSKSTN